jgi:hypothetical protein
MPDEFGYPLPGEPGYVGPFPQYTFPPSYRGGSNDANKLLSAGNVGRSVQIAVDPASTVTPESLAAVPIAEGSPVGKATLLALTGDDSESSVVSVTLADLTPLVVSPAAPAAQFANRASALVEWGVGGVQDNALIDFLNGTTFSIVGAYLRITAILDVIGANIGPVPTPQAATNMILGAYCGYGAVGKSNTFNAKKTVYIDQFATGVNDLIAIPKHATNYIVYLAGFDVEVSTDVLNYGQNELVTNDWGAAGTNDIPVELPGDAKFVFIRTNARNADVLPQNATLRVVFGISF